MNDHLITGATVRTGTGQGPIRDGAVLIRGDKIAAVGDRATVSAQASPSADVTTLPPSSTLMPGLIDGFVRLSQSGSSTPYDDLVHDRDSGRIPERIAENAALALRAGVTTMRDVGDDHGSVLEFIKQAGAGSKVQPRILGSGAPLTPLAGDAAMLGGEVDSEPAIRTAIADRAAAGASFISYHDSGSYYPGPLKGKGWVTQFKPSQCDLIAAEAHRHGLRASSHTYATEGIRHAVAARVDIVDQAMWSAGPDYQFDRDATTAQQMQKQGTAACLPSGRNRLEMIENWGEETVIDRWYSRFTWLDSLDVPLLVGSSAGVTTAPFGDFVSALETWEWLGFGGDRILELATRDAAQILGIGDTTGTIQPGFSADLIVVDGDPSVDLQALRRVRTVMVGGQQLDL